MKNQILYCYVNAIKLLRYFYACDKLFWMAIK